MGMTAQQIRASMKPMLDFAPAIIAAADIVEAAEGAEKVLAALEQSKAPIQADITALQAKRESLQADLSNVSEKTAAASQAIADAEADRDRKLTAIAAQVRGAADNLEKSLTADQAKLDALNAQISTAEKSLADLQAKLGALKNAIPA